MSDCPVMLKRATPQAGREAPCGYFVIHQPAHPPLWSDWLGIGSWAGWETLNIHIFWSVSQRENAPLSSLQRLMSNCCFSAAGIFLIWCTDFQLISLLAGGSPPQTQLWWVFLVHLWLSFFRNYISRLRAAGKRSPQVAWDGTPPLKDSLTSLAPCSSVVLGASTRALFWSSSHGWIHLFDCSSVHPALISPSFLCPAYSGLPLPSSLPAPQILLSPLSCHHRPFLFLVDIVSFISFTFISVGSFRQSCNKGVCPSYHGDLEKFSLFFSSVRTT